MKKITRQIKIGPYMFEVKHVPDLRDEDGKKLYGRHDGTYKVIEISSRQCEDMKRETVIHECLHAIIDVTGLDVKGLEESYVTAMSPVIMSWMRDNKKMVKWILNEDTK